MGAMTAHNEDVINDRIVFFDKTKIIYAAYCGQLLRFPLYKLIKCNRHESKRL